MFKFPSPVNEVVARTVAGFVLLTSVVYVATGAFWVLLFLLFGFLVRVLNGPRFSPTAWMAIHLVVPLLPFDEKLVAGPPKRFAQGVGLFVVSVAVLVYLSGFEFYSKGLIGLLILFAALECLLGFCAGCHMFGVLMRLGIIPESVCLECNLTERQKRL